MIDRGWSNPDRRDQPRSICNGLTETNTWTQDYELGRCQLFDGATTLVDRSLVRVDALNLTGITDNVTAANSQTFGYSAANRLNAASGPYGTYSWSYDLVGNRTVEAVTPSGGSLTTDTYAYQRWRQGRCGSTCAPH